MKKIISKVKTVLVSVICTILAFFFVILPLLNFAGYEIIFGMRFRSAEWTSFSVSDFDGLTLERSDFYTDNGITLAGYKYSSDKINSENIKGVIILAHGLGGGHIKYLPIIDYFTKSSYLVFAYDVRGNDNSQGHCVEGLPQGVIDLDYALSHVEKIEEYGELPKFLFGHSWGAFSVGCALSDHPEIKAAVVAAGFDRSEDMMLYESDSLVGDVSSFLLNYVKIYEKIKFGRKYGKISAVEGMENSNADVMILHSTDDSRVPVKYGYDRFYSKFSDSERFEFVLYSDRGHGGLFYSENARKYRNEISLEYEEFLKENSLKDTEKNENKFMSEKIDKTIYFELDYDVMEDVIALYDKHSKK